MQHRIKGNSEAVPHSYGWCARLLFAHQRKEHPDGVLQTEDANSFRSSLENRSDRQKNYDGQ